MFTPSIHSYGAHEAATTDADPLKLYGIDRLDEDKLRAAAKTALAKMWKTPVFTKERVALEKRTNALAAAADRAKGVKHSKVGKGDPAKLWVTPNKDRPVDVLAAAVQIGMGVPSDAINAIAGGAKAGPGMVDAEMRKSILGGLVALQAAGVPGVHTKGLKAPLVGSDAVNAELAKAAGKGGASLKDAYAAMVKRVAAYGSAMCTLAWSYRVQLWLKDVAGIEKVHAASGAIVALFVPIGTAVGAAIGGHSAITLAVAHMLGLKADLAIKKALPAAKAAVTKRQGGGAGASSAEAAAAAASSGNLLWWALGLGGLALGGAYAYRESQRHAV